MWLRLIVECVALALYAVSVTSMLRAIGPIGRLAAKGVKPWACDVCMTFWLILGASLGLSVVFYASARKFVPDIALIIFPAHAVALLVLARLRPIEFPKEMSDE
jgi:hypothetical protein